MARKLLVQSEEATGFVKSSGDATASSLMQLIVFSNAIHISVFLGKTIRSRASISTLPSPHETTLQSRFVLVIHDSSRSNNIATLGRCTWRSTANTAAIDANY